jgi:hypothetical protein
MPEPGAQLRARYPRAANPCIEKAEDTQADASVQDSERAGKDKLVGRQPRTQRPTR